MQVGTLVQDGGQGAFGGLVVTWVGDGIEGGEGWRASRWSTMTGSKNTLNWDLRMTLRESEHTSLHKSLGRKHDLPLFQYIFQIMVIEPLIPSVIPYIQRSNKYLTCNTSWWLHLPTLESDRPEFQCYLWLLLPMCLRKMVPSLWASISSYVKKKWG